MKNQVNIVKVNCLKSFNRCFIVIALVFLMKPAHASLVIFAFTNSSTGMLDTNNFFGTPRSNIQNADGTWNTVGPTRQFTNPTGYSTNYLVANNWLITNRVTGFWDAIRVDDSSSNLVWAGSISLHQNANPFINLVYVTPNTNLTWGPTASYQIGNPSVSLHLWVSNGIPLGFLITTNSN